MTMNDAGMCQFWWEFNFPLTIIHKKWLLCHAKNQALSDAKHMQLKFWCFDNQSVHKINITLSWDGKF